VFSVYRQDKIEKRADSVGDIDTFAHDLKNTFSGPWTTLWKNEDLCSGGLPAVTNTDSTA